MNASGWYTLTIWVLGATLLTLGSVLLLVRAVSSRVRKSNRRD